MTKDILPLKKIKTQFNECKSEKDEIELMYQTVSNYSTNKKSVPSDLINLNNNRFIEKLRERFLDDKDGNLVTSGISEAVEFINSFAKKHSDKNFVADTIGMLTNKLVANIHTPNDLIQLHEIISDKEIEKNLLNKVSENNLQLSHEISTQELITILKISEKVGEMNLFFDEKSFFYKNWTLQLKTLPLNYHLLHKLLSAASHAIFDDYANDIVTLISDRLPSLVTTNHEFDRLFNFSEKSSIRADYSLAIFKCFESEIKDSTFTLDVKQLHKILSASSDDAYGKNIVSVIEPQLHHMIKNVYDLQTLVGKSGYSKTKELILKIMVNDIPKFIKCKEELKLILDFDVGYDDKKTDMGHLIEANDIYFSKEPVLFKAFLKLIITYYQQELITKGNGQIKLFDCTSDRSVQLKALRELETYLNGSTDRASLNKYYNKLDYDTQHSDAGVMLLGALHYIPESMAQKQSNCLRK